MTRFVILEHDYPSLHWDLMLENGEALRTWRLFAPLVGSATVEAESAADHRGCYLDYEGPLSGGRGQVVRWDWGSYERVAWSEDEIRLHVEGQRIHGVLLLCRGTAGWLARLQPA